MNLPFCCLAFLIATQLNAVSISIEDELYYTCVKTIVPPDHSETKTFYTIFWMIQITEVGTEYSLEDMNMFIWAGDYGSDYTNLIGYALEEDQGEYKTLQDYIGDANKYLGVTKTFNVSYMYAGDLLQTIKNPLVTKQTTKNEDNSLVPSSDLQSSYIFTTFTLGGKRESMALNIDFDKESKTIPNIVWADNTKQRVGSRVTVSHRCILIDKRQVYNTIQLSLLRSTLEHTNQNMAPEKPIIKNAEAIKVVITNNIESLDTLINTEQIIAPEIAFYNSKVRYDEGEFAMDDEERMVAMEKYERKPTCKKILKYAALVTCSIFMISLAAAGFTYLNYSTDQ